MAASQAGSTCGMPLVDVLVVLKFSVDHLIATDLEALHSTVRDIQQRISGYTHNVTDLDISLKHKLYPPTASPCFWKSYWGI